jgi:hypothetical protein
LFDYNHWIPLNGSLFGLYTHRSPLHELTPRWADHLGIGLLHSAGWRAGLVELTPLPQLLSPFPSAQTLLPHHVPWHTSLPRLWNDVCMFFLPKSSVINIVAVEF